ncbi:Oxysterol-binding protein-related protein 1A [Linum perenne]
MQDQPGIPLMQLLDHDSQSPHYVPMTSLRSLDQSLSSNSSFYHDHLDDPSNNYNNINNRHSLDYKSSSMNHINSGDHEDNYVAFTTSGTTVAAGVVSGILHKWVNYGRGWRPRWFILQDGVLSYYKIHGKGQHNITLNRQALNRLSSSASSFSGPSKVVGEESMRWISRQTRSISEPRRFCHPVGQVHLKVSTIRDSRSDDRRFSVYTGTSKRLQLRAQSPEDRKVWMEALQAVKDMFPRTAISDVAAGTTVVTVPTKMLRQRLAEEGVREEAIQESEAIMRNQISALSQHVHLLNHNQVRYLFTPYSVVDESKNQSKKYSVKLNELSTGSDSEDGGEEDQQTEEEEEEDQFFDTRDFLSCTGSFRSHDDGNNYLSSDDNDDDDDGVDDNDQDNNYPYVKRRKKLPEPAEKERAVSLWSMIKDNIGKDLGKICLPVYFNEPISSLQKCFEDLEYSYLLDRANEWGKRDDNLMRMLNVAAFAVSGYASTNGRLCKPFNPLLGETYEADFPDKGLRFISEKVSHHPMIVACHCEGGGWKMWGDSNLKSKFWGRSIQIDPVGLLTLKFDDGEVYHWSKVTTSIYNLILGKVYCDHHGTMKIEGNGKYSCKLKFKEHSMIDRNPHQVQGIVEEKSSGKTVATLLGKWDDSMHYIIKSGGHTKLAEPQLLWKRSKPSKFPTRYNLTRFAITLNELTPGLEEKLPPTDSRLRPDQRCLEMGQYEMADVEKIRLEQRQRQARKMQESGWKPRWFVKEKLENGSSTTNNYTYRYIGGYWEARENGRWDSCPTIFG